MRQILTIYVKHNFSTSKSQSDPPFLNSIISIFTKLTNKNPDLKQFQSKDYEF